MPKPFTPVNAPAKGSFALDVSTGKWTKDTPLRFPELSRKAVLGKALTKRKTK
jgi:hypothetical protein